MSYSNSQQFKSLSYFILYSKNKSKQEMYPSFCKKPSDFLFLMATENSYFTIQFFSLCYAHAANSLVISI